LWVGVEIRGRERRLSERRLSQKRRAVLPQFSAGKAARATESAGGRVIFARVTAWFPAAGMPVRHVEVRERSGHAGAPTASDISKSLVSAALDLW